MQKRVMDLEKGERRRESMKGERDQAGWFGNGRIRPSKIALDIPFASDRYMPRCRIVTHARIHTYTELENENKPIDTMQQERLAHNSFFRHKRKLVC